MATSAPKAGSKATNADAAQQEEKPKKSRIWIYLFVLLIVLGCGAGGAWYFLGQTPAAHHPAKPAAAEAKPPVFLPMDSFTVNLQSEHGEQFLQTSFTLQLPNEAQVELIKVYMPHVRSRLLLLLSSKKASEILTTEGKNKLSEEIIGLFKKPLMPQGPTVNITSVLFTSFVVQ